ncbi:MAG: hypothetical protein LBV41_07235 [Cytophagaceae bacterium]|jgi:hypothetical protein|nr:hypothetical protein [Cytophagaceae bacterium]
MKKLIFAVGIAAVISACGGSASKQNSAQGDSQAKAAVETMTVDSLMAVAETLVDKEVSIKGTVTHVCQHSGKRCFVANADESLTIRIEAGDEIGTFSQELVGTDIAAVGILRENRIVEDEIQQMEVNLEEMQAAEDADTEHCATEAANISQMREWMKKHGKDYYAIYYVDGQTYTVQN